MGMLNGVYGQVMMMVRASFSRSFFQRITIRCFWVKEGGTGKSAPEYQVSTLGGLAVLFSSFLFLFGSLGGRVQV
jgi:hypothetical protein